MIANSKVAIIAGLVGNFDALKQLKIELEIKGIQHVISLGNSVGLHYDPNKFIDEIKNIDLLLGNYEKILIGTNPMPEGGSYSNILMLNENKSKISLSSKQYLLNLPRKHNIQKCNIFGNDNLYENDKVNFYFPNTFVNTPMVIDDALTPLPINEKIFIKNFIGKGIFPGLIYSVGHIGEAYYGILEGEHIIFYKFTFKWGYNYSILAKKYGIIEPNKIEKYWSDYLKENR